MLKRTITGSCYVAVLVGFFLLREFVDYRLFHILTWLFTVIGTFEVARALKAYTVKGAFACAIGYAIAFVPVYCIFEYLFFSGWGWLFALDLTAVMLIAVSVISIITGAESKNFLASVLSFVYPAVFLLTMLLSNDLGKNGFSALLTAFVISPVSDTFAYIVGSLVGGPKLCPKLSPKKTWSGAIGGTVGGILSSIAVYFIFKPQVNFSSPLLLFVIIGLVGSIVNIFGDLFESYVKRKVGIKDMGNLLPGHGGVMDRIDGTLFATAFIYLIFKLV